MMGGDQGEDFVFHSSDSEDAGWEVLKAQSRHRLKKKGFCLSSSSSSSSSTSPSTNTDSPDHCTATSQNTHILESPNHLIPKKKRPVSESCTSNNVLHSKRNCSHPHLPMGNGFRHERVGNNTASGDPNPNTSKSSEMSWQGRQTDRTNQSSAFNQPSGSSQETSSRQSRYHNQVTRRNLILSSDSDDDNDWTERTSDNATFQSHTNSPEQATSQQRNKRAANNPTRKSKTGYQSRPSRDAASNSNATSQSSTSQTNKDSGATNGVTHHNHRLKRNTAATSGVSGVTARSSNDDESRGQSQNQATPKNRHLHRLRMHQNRTTAAGVSSYAGSSESEAFSTNVPFRRDDPGRRAFSRSGHPLHGRRSQGSPHHHHRSPLLRGQESSFQNLVRRHPDLFDSESTDDGSELFAGGTNSLTRNSFRQSSPRHRNSFQYQTFGSATLPESERINLDDPEDPSVVFVPDSRVSPMSRNRRRDQGRFTGGSGRRRRSSRPSHLLSSERGLLSSSPDPVAQVNQMEEDERLARLLQAEFDAELSIQRHNENGGHVYHSESDVDILLDEEETSSLSSSSSNAEDNSHGGGHHQSQYFRRNPIVLPALGEAGPSEPPARGRRRGARAPASTPPVAPPRHWHGSPVRGRRGRTRSSSNADPFTFFGRWLGWAIIRNLDTEENDYEVLWNLAESMGEAVPRGLQRHEINRLPTHKYQPAVTSSENVSGAGTSSSNNNNINKSTTFTEATKECRVCLCDYEADELLRVLPCFHEFHAVCIDKWLKNNNTCPVCRAEIALDS